MSNSSYRMHGRGPLYDHSILRFDDPPNSEMIANVVSKIGEAASAAMKVEVAFRDLLTEFGLSSDRRWSGSSKDLITVPLGPRGAREVQTLEVGKGLAHHGLIVGRPGSGKTNLMHVIITSLALAYPPEELELYLIDFKKGVGFKSYADNQLPHARVIAIESEREFGISVLRGLDKELTERGELFRAAKGAEKLSEYRERTGRSMTRIVLIADEFQEFFTVEDAITREASLLFDRIVRQGRAFGIHMILGTQTLAGSYGIGRSTIDQMAIRIALQCSDADSRLILGDDNPGARFLSRPGEAIYNAENGVVQANKLFQVALFTDSDKEQYLKMINERVGHSSTRKPIVFEGHIPADLERSDDVSALLRSSVSSTLKRGVDAWIGEPIAIKTPNATIARLKRQAGSNLLVVTRDEEQGLGVLTSAMSTLALEHQDHEARFVIIDSVTADMEFSAIADDFTEAMPFEVTIARRRQVPEALKGILRDIEAREGQGTAPGSNIFLIVLGIQRTRELRKDEEDYGTDSPADDLLKILRSGPEYGIHTLAWVDTPSGLTRNVGRKALGEFGLRVAGVMSSDESQSLLEDSGASKIDRPHRLLFFDEEKPGVIEKFRPFSMPTKRWMQEAAKAVIERSQA